MRFPYARSASLCGEYKWRVDLVGSYEVEKLPASASVCEASSSRLSRSACAVAVCTSPPRSVASLILGEMVYQRIPIMIKLETTSI